jgi:hypothetical protein
VAVTAAAAAVAGYAAWAAVAWRRYGHPATDAGSRGHDDLLDRVIPSYDVVERHRIWVAAPAAVTMAAAREQDLLRVPLIRAIFKAREIAMGATAGVPQPPGLLASMQALGWGVLAEIPGREIVMGAVTKPWEANVTFQALPPEEFAAFAQPGFVKIVWTLRVDPLGPDQSIFRTETRAIATDAGARARFRTYWAFASPGIELIRELSLPPLKREAERRATAAGAAPTGQSVRPFLP